MPDVPEKDAGIQPAVANEEEAGDPGAGAEVEIRDAPWEICFRCGHYLRNSFLAPAELASFVKHLNRHNRSVMGAVCSDCLAPDEKAILCLLQQK